MSPSRLGKVRYDSNFHRRLIGAGEEEAGMVPYLYVFVGNGFLLLRGDLFQYLIILDR